MKKILVLAVVLVALLSSVTAFAADKEVVIGQIITSLTGAAAMYGDYQKNAAQMAVDEINASGMLKGIKLKLVQLDDAAKPDVALNAAQKLIFEHNPTVILGADWSGNTLAIAPLIASKGIPQLTSSKSRKITHEGNKTIFRLVDMGPFIGKALVDYAYEKGYRKMAVLYTNSDYGVSGGEGAKRQILAKGLKVYAYETYNVGDTDFTAQLQRIKNSGADCVIDYSIQIEGAKSFRQMRELGINLPVFGGDAFITPDFAQLTDPDLVEGTIAATTFIPGNPDPKVQEFVKKYKKLYGEEPEDHASPYYDAVYIVANAIKAVGTDRAKIADYIAHLKGFKGVNGDHTADKWGNLVHTAVLAKYHNGKWEYIKTITGMTDWDD
ncbi:MAG: ABC transporter substrate-binding protein [Chitinophagales bacterium]